jgi:uncharacterized protein (PEP-CTERM system associated)
MLAGTASAQTTPLPGPLEALTFLPGVRASVRYADVSPNDSRRDGMQLEVSPYIIASANTQRLQVSGQYSLRGFWRPGDDQNQTALRHSLNGRFNAALLDDWLWLQGSAQVGTINTSPVGLVAADPGASFVNTTNFRSFTINPYIRGFLSNIATYRGDFIYTNSNITGAFIARDDYRLSGQLNSGSLFGPNWGWAANGTTQRREFVNGGVLNRNFSTVSLFYLPNPELRLGVSANYDQIDGLTTSDGKTRGIGPGASVDWNPNTRFRFSAQAANQYYGNTASINTTYRRVNTTFGLQASQGIITSFNGSLFNLDPTSIFSGGGVGINNSLVQQLVVQNLLSGFGIPAGAAITNDAVVRDRTITFTVGQILPRGGLTFTAFRSERQSEFDISASTGFGVRGGGQNINVLSVNQLNRDGLRLSGTYKLDSNSNLTAGIRRDRFDSDLQNLESVSNGIDFGYSTRLSSTVTGSTGVRYTRFNTTRPAPVTGDETVVFGAVDVRF